jgi:hypothetical protein
MHNQNQCHHMTNSKIMYVVFTMRSLDYVGHCLHYEVSRGVSFNRCFLYLRSSSRVVGFARPKAHEESAQRIHALICWVLEKFT